MSVSFGDVDAVRSRARAGLLAVLACLVLPACGDDDEPMQSTAPAVTGATAATDAEQAPGAEAPEDEPAADPADDKAAIASTLEGVLTGVDPALVCGELVTQSYLRDAYGGAAGCRAAQADLKPAEKVKLSRVVVLPDSVAQAQAEPAGGLYDGDTLRAELVLDGGVWKLDSLRSNVPVGP